MQAGDFIFTDSEILQGGKPTIFIPNIKLQVFYIKKITWWLFRVLYGQGKSSLLQKLIFKVMISQVMRRTFPENKDLFLSLRAGTEAHLPVTIPACSSPCHGWQQRKWCEDIVRRSSGASVLSEAVYPLRSRRGTSLASDVKELLSTHGGLECLVSGKTRMVSGRLLQTSSG